MGFRDALPVLAIAAVVLAFSSPTLPAQTTGSTTSPSYEVASVRLNTNPNPAWKMEFTPDGVNARDVTLEYALQEAFGVYDSRLWSGAPAWIGQKRFDIEARFDMAQYPHPTLEQRRAMLQQLMADRFKLRIHHQSREFPLYAMVVAGHGPKFTQTRPEDLQQNPSYGVMCHMLRSRRGVLEMQGCTMENLASSLTGLGANDLGRKVVDQTALTGRYDLSLHWTPFEAGSRPGPSTSAVDPTGPAIFTAVKEQLGLKLKPITGPLDTIVIDHIEMPSEN